MRQRPGASKRCDAIEGKGTPLRASPRKTTTSSVASSSLNQEPRRRCGHGTPSPTGKRMRRRPLAHVPLVHRLPCACPARPLSLPHPSVTSSEMPLPLALVSTAPAPPGGPAAPPCDIPSGCCSFTGPWTVTRSSLRMLRRVAAFCQLLRPVLLLVSFPRSRSPVVGVPGAVLDVA